MTSVLSSLKAYGGTRRLTDAGEPLNTRPARSNFEPWHGQKNPPGQFAMTVASPGVKRVFGSPKWHKRLEWAEKTLDERGAYIILIARFIPGGRTAVTFSAGYVRTFPWRRFIVYDVIAGLLWATYAALLGYFGGKTFEDHPLWGVALALGIALTLGLVVELVRHYRQRRATPSA